jgi:hypothetical protein
MGLKGRNEPDVKLCGVFRAAVGRILFRAGIGREYC